MTSRTGADRPIDPVEVSAGAPAPDRGKPIPFRTPMIRALLEGRKPQDRRALKEQLGWLKIPYAPGDLLWVREAHSYMPRTAYALPKAINPSDTDTAAYYRADFDRSGKPRWRPGIHMPRWASRLTLIVESVKVERLQEISEADAIAEGMAIPRRLSCGAMDRDPVEDFCCTWNAIHGPGAWDANPWVAAITFSVIRANIDALPPSPERGR